MRKGSAKVGRAAVTGLRRTSRTSVAFVRPLRASRWLALAALGVACVFAPAASALDESVNTVVVDATTAVDAAATADTTIVDTTTTVTTDPAPDPVVVADPAPPPPPPPAPVVAPAPGAVVAVTADPAPPPPPAAPAPSPAPVDTAPVVDATPAPAAATVDTATPTVAPAPTQEPQGISVIQDVSSQPAAPPKPDPAADPPNPGMSTPIVRPLSPLLPLLPGRMIAAIPSRSADRHPATEQPVSRETEATPLLRHSPFGLPPPPGETSSGSRVAGLLAFVIGMLPFMPSDGNTSGGPPPQIAILALGTMLAAFAFLMLPLRDRRRSGPRGFATLALRPG